MLVPGREPIWDTKGKCIFTPACLKGLKIGSV